MVNVKKLIYKILIFITLPNVYFVRKIYKKIIFLHIPHCGGNTIHRFLKFNFGNRGKKIILKNTLKDFDILEDGKDHFYNFGHFGLDYIKKYFDDKNFFYIMNIRNPRNFYLSNYFRDKKYNSIYTPTEKFPSIEQYLQINKDLNKDNIFCRYLSGSFIYKPSNTKVNDEIFEKAVNNLKLFHCIFIVEESKQSLDKLSKKLKIPLNFTSIFKPHANKHSNSKYPLISEEANELLESMVTYDNKLYEIVLKKNNL